MSGNLTTPEAARLARDLGARVAVPRHYEMFELNAAAPDAFVAGPSRIGQPFRVWRRGERLTIAEAPASSPPR